MHIINLTKLSNGAHQNNNSDSIAAPPDGWAMIPDGFPLPDTFPRLGVIKAEEMAYARTIVAEDGTEFEIMHSMMTVTEMTEAEPMSEEVGV